MPFYFPKALLFKEWRQQRLYLAVGILLFSIQPLIELLTSSTHIPIVLRDNVEGIEFPWPGFLLLIFSAGIALMTLYEGRRDGGVQIAAEPVSFADVLRTKFFMGSMIVVGSQTGVTLWLGVALAMRQALHPVMTLFSFWLISILLELSVYAVTFVLVLMVKPVVFSILLTGAVLMAPLVTFSRFFPAYSLYHGLPEWRLRVYFAIANLSPFGIVRYLHYDMTEWPNHFLMFVCEPIVWPLVGYLLVLWLGRRVMSHAVEPWSETTSHPRLQIMIRVFATLAAAVVLQRFGLHLNTTTWPLKFLVVGILWFCCHLVAHAAAGFWGANWIRRTANVSISEGSEKK